MSRADLKVGLYEMLDYEMLTEWPSDDDTQTTGRVMEAYRVVGRPPPVSRRATDLHVGPGESP